MSHYVPMDHSFLAHKLSLAELSALRLDGDISSESLLWDVPQSWRNRTTHVLGRERHPLVLTGLSAVWGLIGGFAEPLTHTASIVSDRRIRVPMNSDVVIEERTLADSDYWMSHNVGVTTPLRTITDLLRMDNLEEVEVLEVSQSVMTHFSVEISAIRDAILKMTSVPNKRLALLRLEKLVV